MKQPAAGGRRAACVKLGVSVIRPGQKTREILFISAALFTRPCGAGGRCHQTQLSAQGQYHRLFFNYYLITMKWGDHFQVASGKSKNHTKNGQRYWTTTFGNGDGLAYFPDTQQYYLFYAGSDEPVPCTEHGSYVYPVITPPRYENSLADRQEQAQASDSETDDSPVVLSRPGTQG